jgi:predicted dinucleotide-utilizing enzyme
MMAVQNDGLSLEFANRKLRNDREIVIVAFKKNSRAMKYASKQHGMYLESLKAFQDDKDVVNEAVKQDGGSIVYVCKELQNNKEIIFIATKTFLKRKPKMTRILSWNW